MVSRVIAHAAHYRAKQAVREWMKRQGIRMSDVLLTEFAPGIGEVISY